MPAMRIRALLAVWEFAFARAVTSSHDPLDLLTFVLAAGVAIPSRAGVLLHTDGVAEDQIADVHLAVSICPKTEFFGHVGRTRRGVTAHGAEDLLKTKAVPPPEVSSNSIGTMRRRMPVGHHGEPQWMAPLGALLGEPRGRVA